MSIDESILCAAAPEPLSVYVEREGLAAETFKANDDGAWGGTLGGARFELVMRKAWDADEVRRNDRWLGERAEAAVGINGRSLADWSVVGRVARRIAQEAKGVYVSLDERRVLYSPKAAKKKREDKAALGDQFDAALAEIVLGDPAMLDALVSATVTAKAKKKKNATTAAAEILRLFVRALRAAVAEDASCLGVLAECAARSRAALFALHHEAKTADEPALTPGFEPGLSGDPLVLAIVHASARLGANAGRAVRELAAAHAREREKAAGARWAESHPPSTVDAAAFVRQARGGDLHAMGVVFGWRALGFGRWLMKQHAELAAWPLFADGPML